MISQGQAVARQELAPGDLVFFGRKKRVTHVGIYTGQNRYIHSPGRGRSIQECGLYDRARGEYYLGARRILPDADLAPAAGTAGQLEAFQAAKPQVPEKAPKTPSRTHKVKAGDTLYDLARKYGLSQAELARANQLNPRQQASLRLGQILKVPTRGRRPLDPIAGGPRGDAELSGRSQGGG
jgi:LysM repeat protein